MTRMTSTFATRDYVFVERTSIATTASVPLGTENKSKLQAWQLKPYRTVNVGPSFLWSLRDGTRGTASIKRTTRITSFNGYERNIEQQNDSIKDRKNKKHESKVLGLNERRKYAFHLTIHVI